jgi:hypothetical protein
MTRDEIVGKRAGRRATQNKQESRASKAERAGQADVLRKGVSQTDAKNAIKSK